ncbi:hypothetical protein T10_3176 [Trichinella papuae]|uniref:Uncharacterized protein n=1 Tax=Trichinella papuae TaxID=268474 RepID=A0A0V1MTK3_9BILA|nr:hypothetical protein T10_3176 [Trichinella papuae]
MLGQTVAHPLNTNNDKQIQQSHLHSMKLALRETTQQQQQQQQPPHTLQQHIAVVTMSISQPDQHPRGMPLIHRCHHLKRCSLPIYQLKRLVILSTFTLIYLKKLKNFVPFRQVWPQSTQE